MKSHVLTLHLTFAADDVPGPEQASRFVASLPRCDDVASVVVSAADGAALAGGEPDGIPFTDRSIEIGNAAVLPNQRWSALLSYLQAPGRASSLTFAGRLGGDFPRVWAYLRLAATATATELRPRFAVLAGFGPTANPMAEVAGRRLPKTFGPCTWVSLDGVNAAVEQQLRALPEARVEDLAGGLVIEPRSGPGEPPSPGFVKALAALEGAPVYTHRDFPGAG